MHDPEVTVFDLNLPIPRRVTWRDRQPHPAFTIGRRTFTNPEHLGQPIYPWFRPQGYEPRVFGRTYQWFRFITVWHEEPDGHDSGSICKGMGGTDLTWKNVVWAWQHRAHLSFQVHPYQRVDRWLRQRCAACGRRFFWKDARFGYMGSNAVYHDECSSLARAKHQLEDAAKVMTFTADKTERWRVEQWLEWRSKRDADAAQTGRGVEP